MKPWAYYNENDPFAAEWLLQLIARGLIADGDVDDRDMRKVEPNEIRHYTQHHFFAGIGGWSLALRLAGWPDDKPVLTGSPPCQPFSVAGKQLGAQDERHLAPHFLELVAALRPPWVFGEQVAAAVKKDEWLDDLLDALENEGYTTGALVLPACGVGAPHLRQRLWFVGRLGYTSSRASSGISGVLDANSKNKKDERSEFMHASLSERLADSTLSGDRAFDRESRSGIRRQGEVGRHGISGGLDDTGNPRSQDEQAQGPGEGRTVGRASEVDGLGLADGTGPQPGDQTATTARHGNSPEPTGSATGPTHAAHGGWETVDWLLCRDGKWRPAQPGIQPLAHGLPKGLVRSGDSGEPNPQEARVMRLRGYGNAIVPQVAAEIIREVM